MKAILALAIVLMAGNVMADETDGSMSLDEIRASAEKGDAESQNQLGAIYDRGLMGVAKDRAEAVKWYVKAAEQNLGAAQLNLCSVYGDSLNALNGVRPPKDQPLGPIEPVKGAKQDVDAAFKWCVKAAEKQFSRSQRMAGILFAKGAKSETGETLVKPDYERAFFWLWLARTGTDAFTDAVAAKLTPERRTAIEQETKAWNSKTGWGE